PLRAYNDGQRSHRTRGSPPPPEDDICRGPRVRFPRGVGFFFKKIVPPADALVGQPLLGIDQQVLEHPLAGAVVGDQLGEVVALGGGVLGVAAHIEIQPRAVAQEHVRTAAPRHHPPEQIAGNLVGAQPAMAMERAGDTDFCLDAHDSSLHVVETTGCWPTTARKPRRSHAVDSDWRLRQGRPMTAPWQAVGLFILLTVCLSGIFWAVINAAYFVGLMWMLGVAAILTCRILGRPLRTLGLGTWNGRYALIGYLIPIVYCLVASLGI